VVISCIIHRPTSNPGAKKTKKTSPSPSVPADQCLEVILHDTVIFPEGGGQPSDIGLLITSDGKEWDVVEAKRRGGTAVHFVRIRDGDVSNAVEVFSSGARVTVALGQLGFDRRYDHVRKHPSIIVRGLVSTSTRRWQCTRRSTCSRPSSKLNYGSPHSPGPLLLTPQPHTSKYLVL
jgi:Ser-tRNA(Ala) deacylase AlaX